MIQGGRSLLFLIIHTGATREPATGPRRKLLGTGLLDFDRSRGLMLGVGCQTAILAPSHCKNQDRKIAQHGKKK